MSPLFVWITIIGLSSLLIFYISRVVRTSETEGHHDMGVAILEFGRAFPDEAIRDLRQTTDGGMIFVRLHDGKAGLMRNRRNHFACHVIEPGRVRVTPMPSAKGFSAEFLDAPTQNGDFVFRTEGEAAEVSLWLLDNYVTVEDRTLDGDAAEGDGAAKPERAS